MALEMKYFVLKPKGDDEYAKASRYAMVEYAAYIKPYNAALANELDEWADREKAASIDRRCAAKTSEILAEGK